MKHLLRKTTTSVSVTYSNGNYSNNLTGTDFELERSEFQICLSINLVGNLTVRNKAANCYYDACELAADSALLKAVQIDEDQVIDGLSAANRNTPNANWQLSLGLGEKGKFDYAVKPEMVNGSLFLNVC